MTDYTALSDFEINCLVARKQGEIFTIPKKGKSNPYLSITERTIEKLNCDGTKVEREIVKDFCNNPSAAWPIILQNNITLHAPMSYDDPHKWLCFAVNDSDVDCMNTNPLRAAMIVFLMMQENTSD